MSRQTGRLWSDKEKRRIYFQTAAPGVSFTLVALRYSVNANLIVKWMRDARCTPDLTAMVGDLPPGSPSFMSSIVHNDGL